MKTTKDNAFSEIKKQIRKAEKYDVLARLVELYGTPDIEL